MIDIDAAGAAANSQDRTRAARKAEKRIAREAWRATAWGHVGAIIRQIPLWCFIAAALAVVISATAFDWFMSSRGWGDILPGLGLFAGFGAAASVGFWYVGVHQAWAGFAAKKLEQGWTWAAVATAGYIICIVGVGLATLTNTSQARAIANKSTIELALLKAEHDGLKSDLDITPIEVLEANLARSTRTLAGQISMAKGTYGMADLDVDSGCAAEALKFAQRRLCVLVNGGIDEGTGRPVDGLRSDVDRDEAALKAGRNKALVLKELNERIRGFKVETGDKMVKALAEFMGDDGGNLAVLILIPVLSALFLFAGGFFARWLISKIPGVP